MYYHILKQVQFLWGCFICIQNKFFPKKGKKVSERQHRYFKNPDRKWQEGVTWKTFWCCFCREYEIFFCFCAIAIHAHWFDRHPIGVTRKERGGVLESIQVLRSSFSSLKVGIWDKVKNDETVQSAMLQCAPLYHIIWRRWNDREDHMIYKQRQRGPTWYEPASILKTRFSTKKDLPQNQWCRNPKLPCMVVGSPPFLLIHLASSQHSTIRWL